MGESRMSANCMKAKMLSAALFAALVLSAMQSVRADEAAYNYWEGGSGNSWTDKNSETGKYKWTTGELPTATETAAFKQGAQTVKIKEGKCLAAKVVFESGSVITFSRLDSGTADAVTAGEFSGEGTLKLLKTGLKAAYEGCTVSVAGFEVLHDSSYPSNYSWLDGGTAESEKMVVESAVTGSGNLACNNYVEVNGDVTLTGFLKLSANATVKNLVYDNGGCKIASDSAGGTIEKVTVKSGTLEYSSSTLKSVSAITVGKFVLDGGTLSVASDFSSTIAVAEGGGTLFLEGEWNDAASVSLPAGLSFAEGADLSKVTVQATIGESTNPAIFAIVNDNEAYSLEYVGYPFHLEELDLSWMTSGWEHPVTNKSIYSISDGSYTSLRLWNGSDWQSYSKGISVQAESHLIIKLGGNGSAFSALVGLDRSADGDGRCGSKVVKFAVRDVVGGTNLVESAWLGTKTEAQTITADLSGIDFIDLVVYPDPDNGGGWQHCDWVNPTIVMKGDAAPVTRSADGTNHWTGMGENDYWVTVENWEFGVPAADATAVFDESVTVRIGQTGENSTTPEKITVSNVVVNSGATLTLRPVAPEFYDGPELIVQEINGAGKIQLAKVGIKANYVGDSTECTVNVAEIEMLPVTRWYNEIDSWLQGGSDEGKFMVVNSTVTGTGRFYTHGNVTLNGDVAMSREFKMDSENASAKTVILDGGWVSAENLGEIEKLAFHSGTYNYADYSDKGWPLYLDGGTVNIGDGSSIGSDGLELGVLSGGYLRYTVSEIPETGVPDFPVGLTFAANADLSNVFAIVKNNSGDTQKAYTITKTGDDYSFAELEASDTVKWIGGIDNNWATAGNWIYGAVPTNGQMVVFGNNASVIIGADVTADITITSSSRVSFRSSDTAHVHPNIFTTTVTGGGRVALEHVGLRAISNKNSTVDVSELEIVNCGNDSWLQGVDENNPLTVSSAIVGNGKLCVYSYVLFNGDNSKFAGNWGMGNQWGSTGCARFASGNSGFSACSSSACYGDSRIYLDTDEEVVFASLTLPSGNDRIVVTVPDATLTACAESNDIELSGNVVLQGEGSSLTVRKIGPGTLKTGLAGVYSLKVEQGRAEFCADNSGVSVSVSSCASIGSTADVTIGAVTFVPGGMVKQDFIVTPVTEEQLEPVYENETFISNIVHIVETGDYLYSMRRLTIARDVDLANVVFGVTNPEDLPEVTKAAVAGLPRFTMFAANSLSGAVSTENDGYTPTGSEKNGRWIARQSRAAANTVEFVPYVKSGLAIVIR